MICYEFINNKGGVGRTQSSMNMLLALAREGKKVLGVDLDPQANFSGLVRLSMKNWTGRDMQMPVSLMAAVHDENPSEAVVSFPKTTVSLLCSSDDFKLYDRYMAKMYPDDRDYPKRVAYLSGLLNPLFAKYDAVVVDTPPTTQSLTNESGLYFNNLELILTIQTQPDSLKGSKAAFADIRQHIGLLQNNLKNICVLPTFFRKRNSMERAVLSEIKDSFGADNTLHAIPYMARLERYSAYGYPADSKADYFDKQVAKQYRQAFEGLLKEADGK